MFPFVELRTRWWHSSSYFRLKIAVQDHQKRSESLEEMQTLQLGKLTVTDEELLNGEESLKMVSLSKNLSGTNLLLLFVDFPLR